MKFVCPLLVVKNIEISRKFYEDVLDQRVKFDFGENVTFEGDFAIHLENHFSALIENKPVIYGSNNFEIYFENNEPELLVKKLEELKVELVHPLREQPWRQRVVRFYDPDKHIIEVGESMEHVAYRLSLEGISHKHISEITYMPVEFVQKAIDMFIK